MLKARLKNNSHGHALEKANGHRGDIADDVQKLVRRIEKLERQRDPLLAMPYEKLAKFVDGTIDWATSEQRLKSQED